MVISLKNRPKGGDPVIISAAITKSALAIGVRPNVPPPISFEVGRAVELRERAGRKERDRLGERVIGHVQNRAEGARLAAEPDPHGHDAHVLDARIGQQPLQVPLDQDERRGHEHREQPERQQQAAGERRAERRLRDQVDPQDAVQRAVQHADGHQHAGRRRRFAVRIGLPRVHRRQARLRAVPDQREHDAEPQRERMQRRAPPA